MALLERLQILIDADGKGAIREFDKIGAQADKLDAKLKGGSEKVAARLTSIGSKAALGGVAIVGGLAKLAMMSEEAEKQQIKLANSIKNSNQAFSGGGKGLKDLATSLQQVTAADGDAIIGAESLLVTFGLTEKQVKTLTPLVVDLSRKYGIDLDQAAKIAGKAVNGSAGALKKLGINVDEAALKADGFGTTVEALGAAAGGFARQEGQTFSGQLAIIKNNLGDLGESVGKGAAGVFGALTGDAAKAVGALNKLNPAILETVGAVGATGGLTATLAGGFAFAAGKAVQFASAVNAGKTALVNVGEDGTKSLTKVGKAAAGIAIVSAIVGVIETVATISNSINNVAELSRKAFDGFRGALKGTNAELADAFAALVEVEDKSAEFSGLWEGFGAEISLGNFKADIEEVQGAFDQVLDNFGPEAAQKVLDGLKAQNEALDKNSDQYKTNADFIDKNQAAVTARKDALTKATIAERDQKKALQQATVAYDRQANTIEGINQTIADYNNKLRLLTSRYDAAQAGAKAFSEQLNRSSTVEGFGKAIVSLSDGLRTLAQDVRGLPSFAESLDPTKITEAGGKALSAFYSVADQAKAAIQAAIAAGSPDALAIAENYRNAIVTALQNANVPQDTIDKLIKAAGLDNESITIAVKFAKDQASLDALKLDLELFATELSNDPNAMAFIKAAVAQGDFAGALAFIQKWLKDHPAGLPVKPYLEPGDPGYTGPPAPGDPGYGGPATPRPAPPEKKRPWWDPRGWWPEGFNPGSGFFAKGGRPPVAKTSMVNELGPEMFVPDKPGFILDADKSQRLIEAVQALVDGNKRQPAPATPTATPMAAPMAMAEPTPTPIKAQPITLPVLVAKAAPPPDLKRPETTTAQTDQPVVVEPIVNVAAPKIEIPEPKAPVVNVPEIKAPKVDVAGPKVDVAGPTVNVPPAKAPNVNVAGPTVNVPKAEPAKVLVAAATAPAQPAPVAPQPFAPAPAPVENTTTTNTTTVAPVTNNFHIVSPEPTLTALEVVRKQRDAAFLMGR